MSDNLSVPAVPTTSSTMEKINSFLDKYILPWPVKYLTNRITILGTLCLLIPLIVLADVTVFVLAANSYLNVMSVVVSSTVLLYSTLAEARDRDAAQRREEIAKTHQAMMDQRAEKDHERIEEIHEHLEDIRKEISEHVNQSLDNIQKLLVERLETIQKEDHVHIEEMHRAVIASNEAHHQELAELAEIINAMHQTLSAGAPGTQKPN